MRNPNLPPRSCADCSRQFKPRAKNTKYCDVCGLWRNLKFIAMRNVTTRKCYVCESSFAPIKINEPLCHECNDEQTKNREHVTCVFCGEHTYPLIGPDIAVCWACGHRPELRQKLIQAVHAKAKAFQADTPDEADELALAIASEHGAT